MKTYSQNVMIVATAYVKAENELEARTLFASQLKGAGVEIPTFNATCMEAGDVTISGERFENLEPGEVSLSPAMTVHSPLPDIWAAD